MGIPVRNSVKALLLNEENELLLMCADDPKTTSADKTYHGKFWHCIGGRIEPGESIQDAALREIYEETGFAKEDVDLGPVVWFGEFVMVLHGTMTQVKQTFVVARTHRTQAVLTTPDEWEKTFVQNLAWFSLEKMRNSQEVIFPVVMQDYLPDILSGKYPEAPIEINLAKQPDKKNGAKNDK